MDRFTEAHIASLKPPQGSKRLELQDAACPGLWLRVTPEGVKSFAVRYWVRGTKRAVRSTLGRHPTLSLKHARAEAASIIDAARRGLDARYEGRPRDEALTFDEAGLRFFEWRQRQRGSRKAKWSHLEESARRFNVELSPVLGARPLEAITRAEVRTLLANIELRAPTVARHCFHDLSVLFKWAVEEDLIDAAKVPLLGIRKPEKPQSRERVLTGSELQRIWQATAEATVFNVIVRLLILTGQRRGEVAGAAWTEMNIDKATWTIAGMDTKNKQTHCIPLSTLALEIVEMWRKVHATLDVNSLIDRRNLFPTEGIGIKNSTFCGFSRAKRRLNSRANVHHWRLHDLRRTVSTSLAEMKVEPHIIDAVLNHKSGVIKGVAAVYNRHPYLEEKREALERWAAVVRGFENSDQ